MSAFLNLLLIDDYEIAKVFLPNNSNINENSDKKTIAHAMIDEFEFKVKEFYRLGYTTFMQKVLPGDAETQYMHAMCHYFATIIRKFYDEFYIGPGAFNMEGFEYKNFQTKRAIRNHTNHMKNVCSQSLMYMTVMFSIAKHNVEKEVDKRSIEKTVQYLKEYFGISRFFVQCILK